MFILLHVIIALSGIVSTGLAFARSSRAALRASYALVAGTFASGFYLVVAQHAALLPTCETGLVYLAITGVGIAGARVKLARQANSVN